jgi:hypothetical protein
MILLRTVIALPSVGALFREKQWLAVLSTRLLRRIGFGEQIRGRTLINWDNAVTYSSRNQPTVACTECHCDGVVALTLLNYYLPFQHQYDLCLVRMASPPSCFAPVFG